MQVTLTPKKTIGVCAALIVLAVIIAGVIGFRVMSSLDRFPGHALEISLTVKAWPKSPGRAVFAVIGDAGTGGRNQFRLAREMARTYQRQPFGLLLTTGDNVYYGDITDRVEDVVAKPYKPLFDAGVQLAIARQP